MRVFAIMVAAFMVSASFAGEPEFRIDAVVSTATLREVIRQVRKIDKSPILSITQRKKEMPEGQLPTFGQLPSDLYDTDSLMIDTGVLKDSLNGSGFHHSFSRVKGRWVLTQSVGWDA